MGVLNYIKRRFVGDDTTARLSYQQSQGYAYAGYTGDAGFHTLRTMAATSPGGIVPGNSLKLNDPSVTGNNSDTIALEMLSDPRSF